MEDCGREEGAGSWGARGKARELSVNCYREALSFKRR
jgi:hypothetical protein